MRWLVVVAVLATTTVPARADDDSEKPTAVTVALAGTTVRLHAKFAFDIEGPGVALSTHSFALPPHSVVTGGTAIIEGKRHRLQLDKADAVDKAFDALTLKPASDGERAWAFVLEGTSDLVTIDVLAPRSAHVVLELTVEAPTCFHKDVRYVELPAAWWHRVADRQRNAIKVNRADVSAACNSLTDEPTTEWIGFISDHLAKQPAGEQRIGAIAGRLSLESTHFARVEIDLARELTEVPADLHTAIVIDHSRSLTADELEAQRGIVMAYVRGAPTSHVQLIAYARTAEPLLPGWMVASHARPQIDRLIRAQPPRNGSNVDAALAEAAAWLSRVQGTKRILLFSDERLAERFESSDGLRVLVPSDVLVHLVHPTSADNGIERTDDPDSVLGVLAAATQGIATFGAVGDSGVIDVTMLLRPVRIDQLAISAVGWKDADAIRDDHACEVTLSEGETCTWWGEGNGAAGPITIAGLLWNKPIKRVLRADPSQARAIARALSVMHALDDELQKQVDTVALAVNSVWSLFAQWGGSGGYEDVGGFGTLGLGSFGTSSSDTFGPPGTGHIGAKLDLRAGLKPAVDGCNPGSAAVTVAVETTLEEIVGVDVDVVPASATLHDCIVEAVWATTLRMPTAPVHATTRVAFGNKR